MGNATINKQFLDDLNILRRESWKIGAIANLEFNVEASLLRVRWLRVRMRSHTETTKRGLFRDSKKLAEGLSGRRRKLIVLGLSYGDSGIKDCILSFHVCFFICFIKNGVVFFDQMVFLRVRKGTSEELNDEPSTIPTDMKCNVISTSKYDYPTFDRIFAQTRNFDESETIDLEDHNVTGEID